MSEDTVYLLATTGSADDISTLQAVAQANFPDKKTHLVVFQTDATIKDALKETLANQVDSLDFVVINGLEYPDPNVLGKAFTGYFKGIEAPLVLTNSSRFNNALAARVAAGLTASIVTDTEQFEVSDAFITVTCKAYSGELRRQVKLDTKGPIILTVTPLKDPVDLPSDKSAAITDVSSDVAVEVPADAKYELTANDGDLNLDNADVVVAGGRGMKSEEGYAILNELGNKMNAAVGASRPVVDNGWTDSSAMIGQSGKSIAPKVYFAFGISGTVQHTIGLENAKCIVAINTDKDAPIFDLADYGIIGDAKTVIQQLIDRADN